MNAPARMAAPAAFDASLTGFSNLLAASGVLTAAVDPDWTARAPETGCF
jgi:hypothetical protein